MIYLIKVAYENVTLLKVGYAKSIKKRLEQYTTENPLFELLDYREGDRKLEEFLHSMFKEYKFEKGLEWFYYDDYIVNNFHSNFDESILIEKVKKKMNKFKSFSSKLRLYCEFKKKYPEIDFIVERFQLYLESLGSDRCRELDYRENLLYKELFNLGYFDDIRLADEEDEAILSDFLVNHFYTLTFFHERLKLYCEFSDKYKDNPSIMEGLNNRIEDPRFLRYYRYFGTKGCSSRKYQEAALYRRWKDALKSDELSSIIYSKYHTGDRYLMSDLKTSLKDIYSSLSISKTAKATDLGEYFELIRTHITIDGVSKSGFKLGEKLR